PLRSKRGLWLLALLALRHGHPVDRDWLAGVFWSESDEPRALGNLRKSLTDLNRALGHREAARISKPTSRTLLLSLSGADVDLIQFDAAIARGDRDSLERAIGLYRGRLVEGCDEDWILEEQLQRAQAYYGALASVAALALADGDLKQAESYAARAVAVEPLR